jgi:hypothetical protein
MVCIYKIQNKVCKVKIQAMVCILSRLAAEKMHEVGDAAVLIPWRGKRDFLDNFRQIGLKTPSLSARN